MENWIENKNLNYVDYKQFFEIQFKQSLKTL